MVFAVASHGQGGPPFRTDDPLVKDRFGAGLLSVFGHRGTEQPLPAGASGDSPGVKDAPEQVVNFCVSTYPQIFLDNPTSAVQQGLVARPDFFLPIDIQDANRIPPGQGVGEFATGYPKQRESTIGIGGRQALNKDKTLNLLLMGGRVFRPLPSSTANPAGSPMWASSFYWVQSSDRMFAVHGDGSRIRGGVS